MHVRELHFPECIVPRGRMNEMLKRITAVLTAGCMLTLSLTARGIVQECMGSSPIVAEATDTYGKNGMISFEFSDDGTLTISGNAAIDDYNLLAGTAAPWTKRSPTRLVIKEGITGIGNEAFMSMSSLISVSIPDSVQTIGISSACSSAA